ncbi:MAG: hypothetical protein J5789_08360 [Oscillospiraceae bacterium]|nr:hypothetical protein [Oscillospiraceae bacterium]
MFTNEILIYSPLSPEEAVDCLQAATIYTRLNPYDPKKALFRGTVGLSSFQISPLQNSDGAFSPRISGTITPMEHGSVLCAKARLSTYSKIFFLIWMAVISFVILMTAIAAVRGTVPFWGPFITLVIPGGGALLAHFGYTVPERNAEERLRKLLQAE